MNQSASSSDQTPSRESPKRESPNPESRNPESQSNEAQRPSEQAPRTNPNKSPRGRSSKQRSRFSRPRSGSPRSGSSSRPSSRPSSNQSRTNSSTRVDANIETEFGVPFAGEILAPEKWAKTALKRLPEAGTIDFAQLFGREVPRILDIGCGNGRFLLSSAVRRPEMDHIGIDPLPMVIRYATRRANVRGLSNCRLAVCDGAKFLREYCGPASLHEIHVYHPQPFPDAAEQHLRLFQHEFLWLVHRALAPGAKLFVQTDNAAYWDYLQTVLPVIMHWHEQAEPWPEDPQGRSRREIVAIHKGLNIYRGWGTRKDDLTRADFEQQLSALPQPNFNAEHNRNPNRWRRS